MQNNYSSVNQWRTGLVSFAGFMMVLVGSFQAIQGFVALINNDFFVLGMNYVFRFDVTTWGWTHLILGVITAIAGISLFSGQGWARVIGIILAFVSAVANFSYIPYYPIWSLLIIALDIGIIWALATFGREDVTG